MSGSDNCQSSCQAYFGHARRVLARLMATCQGYYRDHPGEVSTFRTIRNVGAATSNKGGPPGTRALYLGYHRDWAPARIFIWQLSGLSELIATVVKNTLGSDFSTQQRRSAGFRRLELFESRGSPPCSVSTGFRERTLTMSAASIDTQPESLVLKLPVVVWDLSSPAGLSRMAMECLRDDLSSTQGDAMINRLVSERQLLQLPESHRHYLTNAFIPGLDRGDVQPYFYLAVLLGYFDWGRANPGVESPSPSADEGKLYEEMWLRGMSLQSN